MPTIKPPNLADMRVKYRIEQPSTTQNAYGDAQDAWTVAIPAIWGTQADAFRGSFSAFLQGLIPTQGYTIIVRYRAAIAKQMRVVEIATGRIFLIQDIDNLDHRNQWLALYCKEHS